MIKQVVIWGDDHHNALGILRMLGNRGFDVNFIINGHAKLIASASKYCTRYVEIIGLDAGLKYLLENYQDAVNKAVLLFTADRYSETANNNLDLLEPYFYVAGPSRQGVLTELDDKYTMGMLAKECGINIPETILIPQDNPYCIGCYPLILKPCTPTSKDFKTKVVDSELRYKRALKSLVSGKRYVVQKFIHKEADGLVYGCRTWDGITHLSGICVRNRWSDDGCGSFGYITPDIPDTINKQGIVDFLDKIDFRGLFSVEYAICKDASYFYEFNLRNDGTAVLFYQGGANPVLEYVNSCFEIKEDVPTTVNGKHYLINEIWDKFNVKDGVISRSQYEEDVKKATIFFYYDPDDMRPYEIQISNNKKRYLRRIISKSIVNKIRLNIKRKINDRKKK